MLQEARRAQQRHRAHLTAECALFGRASGDNIPCDAFLDDFDVNQVVAIALHHALQYHSKGGDLRSIDFSALYGQQMLGALSLPG